MKTLIVDVSSVIKGLDPVKPFFYPLMEREDRVRIISVQRKIGERSKFHEELLREAEKELRRDMPRQWQIIFCICLEGMDMDARSPFRGWLFRQLYFIKKLIGDLTQRVELKKPDHVFVIGLDTLERTQVNEQEPENIAFRPIWELDNLGYVTQGSKAAGFSNYVFCEDDLQTISGIWPEDLCASLRNNGLTDGGIRDLSEDAHCNGLDSQIEEKCTEIEKKLQEEIEKKKKLICTLEDIGSRELLKKRLDKFRDHFVSELKTQKDRKIATFTIERPVEKLLKKSIREVMSINSDVSEDIIFLRFELKGMRGNALNQKEYSDSLLTLAYLLVFLSKEPRTVKAKTSQTPTEPAIDSKFWLVKQVKIDRKSLSKILSKYSNRLTKKQSDIEEKLSTTIMRQIPMIRDVCVCGEEELKDPDVKIDLASIHSRKDWDGARDDKVLKSLENYQKNIVQIVEECRDIMLGNQDMPRELENVEMDKKMTQLTTRRDRLRDEMDGEKFEKIEHDWPDVIREENAQINDLFAIEPTRSQSFSTYVLAVLLILIPFGGEAWIHTRAPENLFWENLLTFLSIPVLILAVGGLIHLILKRTWRAGLDRLLKEVAKKAEAAADRLKRIKNQNRKYIRKLCELYMTCRNLKIMRVEAAKCDMERDYLECHKDRTHRHIKNIADLVPEMKSAVISENDDKALPEPGRVENSTDECKLPVHRLELYWPSQFVEDPMDFVFECIGSEEKLSSKYLPGLISISFQRDKSYNWGKVRK